MSFTAVGRAAYKWPRRVFKNLANQERDSRYVFVLIAGALIFLFATIQAVSHGMFDSIERPIFQFFNDWPHLLFNPLYALTQLGSLASLIIWCGLAWYLINRRAAKSVLLAGLAAWLLAKVAKYAVHRGRPEALLPHIHLFTHETFSGFGFPSGHSTLSAACATVLYYQVKPRYRKYLLLAVLLVGVSRMYLGAHFPFDVIGGWALGMTIGAATVLIMGTSANRLSVQRLKKILRRKGYEPRSLTFADVDARGSRPFFLEDASGTKYFGKMFGKQEHAADWLFKIYRFFRFKNLQGEEPYLNSKRNVELEALATMWAANTGARVAKVADMIQAGALWILIQERIDGKPLSDYRRIKDTTLMDAWRQVEKLHTGRLAHRDLRAANLLIDKKGNAWVIDFGFAEVSPKRQRMYMDIAELLMSMSLVVGTKRTLSAAWRIVPHDKLEDVLPYLQKAVFSGATTKLLKQRPELLDDLKTGLHHKLGLTEDEVEEADIVRLNTGKVVNIAVLAAFLYLIVPQFKQFSGTLHSLSHITPGWLILVTISSALTYYFTGWVYVALSDVPLGSLPTALVQLAASFVSKVVPGGLGGTTLNGRYLQRAGMQKTAIAAVLLSQGLIGFLTFILPFGLFLFFSGSTIASLLPVHPKARYVVIGVMAVIAAAILLTVSRKLRLLVTGKITKLIADIRNLTTEPRDISLAAVASLLVTICYLTCLYASVRALAIHLPLTGVILVYASAVIARAAIPTPGGLGPLEVAMVASMVGLGVAKPEAFSAVVLYRLATFWLPIPFSLLAYRFITRRKLI